MAAVGGGCRCEPGYFGSPKWQCNIAGKFKNNRTGDCFPVIPGVRGGERRGCLKESLGGGSIFSSNQAVSGTQGGAQHDSNRTGDCFPVISGARGGEWRGCLFFQWRDGGRAVFVGWMGG